jgi:hypothetical protein
MKPARAKPGIPLPLANAVIATQSELSVVVSGHCQVLVWRGPMPHLDGPDSHCSDAASATFLRLNSTRLASPWI